MVENEQQGILSGIEGCNQLLVYYSMYQILFMYVRGQISVHTSEAK